MAVGILDVDLYFSGCGSLKSKRKILRSIIDRIKRRYNVSVAEVGFRDTWQRRALEIAVAADKRRNIEAVISRITEFLRNSGDAEIISCSNEII